jgi:hypothetical protein
MDGAGHLIIEARAEAYTGSDGIARNYTSARMKTLWHFSQTYGRFEALMKIPNTQGIWPAFWMLGENIDWVGWPGCGEIDIMENIGYEPKQVHATLHGPGYDLGYAYDYGTSLSSAYHLYAVEWDPGVFRFYIDGTLYSMRTAAEIPAGTTWVFDAPEFMLLNLAVGGWAGAPDAGSVFPQQLLVDYVRAYRRDTEQRPFGGNPLPIPGTIQVEEFDDGGQGVAYSDKDPQNRGVSGVTRTSEGADLQAAADTGGGYYLGWTEGGEWLEYTVQAAAAGTYALELRAAAAGIGGGVHFELDGAPLAGSAFSVPDTGAWQNWVTLGPHTVALPAGTHVLRFSLDGPGPGGVLGNFNWFRFSLLSASTPTGTATCTATVTPTATPSRTRSPSATASASPSWTQSANPSASGTGTATATPTPTPSGSGTFSPWGTLTGSATLTITGSVSLSFTPENGASGTFTRTWTVEVGPCVTPTLSQSPPPEATGTASMTASPPASETPSGGATWGLSLTPSWTQSCTPAARGTGTLPPHIRAFPNPQHSQGRLRFWLELGEPVDSLRLRLYSSAMACVGEATLTGLPPGRQWAEFTMPALPAGLYFYKVDAVYGMERSQSNAGKLFILN